LGLDWAQRAMALTSVADLSSPPAVSRLAIALAISGRLDEGLALLDEAMSPETADSPNATKHTLCRGRLRLIDDDLPGARADLIEVVASLLGSSRSAALALGRLSLIEFLTGQWDLAITHAEQGLAACVDRTDYAQITALRAPAVLVLAARGAWQEADNHLHAMRLESGEIALPTTYTAFAGARLAAEKGDPAAVVAALAPAWRCARGAPSTSRASGPGRTSMPTPSSTSVSSTRPTRS